MNVEMAYLLGMICGNGEIRRGASQTNIAIEIPHKKLQTENSSDVRIYVRASITDIRGVLEPLISSDLVFTQKDNCSILSFDKSNDEYLMREILRYVGNATSHENIRINKEIFAFSRDEKISFLRGFADVTGYIRRSNAYFKKYEHRVYLEIPYNWYLVADICLLLKSIDVPVQNIDWAHPNMRDGNLKKFNAGNANFWKKEHQIKIWANEFLVVGFAVIHKKEALSELANEFILALKDKNISDRTHKFYWECREIKNKKPKPIHPSENDEFIAAEIRSKHYESWREIAKDLGYKE